MFDKYEGFKIDDYQLNKINNHDGTEYLDDMIEDMYTMRKTMKNGKKNGMKTGHTYRKPIPLRFIRPFRNVILFFHKAEENARYKYIKDKDSKMNNNNYRILDKHGYYFTLTGHQQHKNFKSNYESY